MDVDFDTAKQKVAGTLRKIPCENTPILSIPAQKFLIGRWSEQCNIVIIIIFI